MHRASLASGVATGVIIAGSLLLWFTRPVCACTPALEGPLSPSLGRAFRDLDLAEQQLRRTSGRYANGPVDLPTVALPAETRVVPLSATDNTYRIRVDSGTTTGRTCIISGGIDASGAPRPVSVDCQPLVT